MYLNPYVRGEGFMFRMFVDEFGVSARDTSPRPTVPVFSALQERIAGFVSLFGVYEGVTFGNGLYTLHRLRDIGYWNTVVGEAFPSFANHIECFGYDWLGRQFALDLRVGQDSEPHVLLFEPGTGDVFEIPCDFAAFHRDEIPHQHDACLASSFFSESVTERGLVLSQGQCMGYIVPLFLGGEDVALNLEPSDMDVYWSLCGQLFC